jgi:hypothetical protein
LGQPGHSRTPEAKGLGSLVVNQAGTDPDNLVDSEGEIVSDFEHRTLHGSYPHAAASETVDEQSIFDGGDRSIGGRHDSKTLAEQACDVGCCFSDVDNRNIEHLLKRFATKFAEARENDRIVTFGLPLSAVDNSDRGQMTFEDALYRGRTESRRRCGDFGV